MQYAPSYYYPGANQQSPNGQQPQQQPQQQHQQQLHMPDHQLYAQQHPQGMPTYQMPMPHPHPSMVHPNGEFNMMTKPKRKQVKNACVNCQKACKKCDDGRPCQRCVKYGFSDTCTNSVRKERKKGVKRGPYKRRNQTNGEGSSPASGSSYSNATSTATTAPYQTYGTYENYQSTTAPNAPGMNYTNPMQQYVMAMQQQQAMYSNLPYQQPMTPASSSSSHPSATNPQTATLSGQASPAGPLSTHASPVPANATTATATPDQTSNTNNNPSTETSITGGNSKPDDSEEGSKLNILSQLCSDALDRSPKPDNTAMTPPTHDQSASTASDAQQNVIYNQQQPIISTPVSSSPSSGNTSPTHKQGTAQMVYPQQQDGQTNYQGQWQ